MKSLYSGLAFSIILIISGFSTLQAQPAGLDTLQLKTVFHEPFLPGVRPQPIGINPAGTHMYFSWNDSSYAETGLYRVDLNGSLTEPAPDDPLARAVISPDENRIAYIQDNQLWVSAPSGANARKMFDPGSPLMNIVWSPDSDKISVVTNGDVWIVSLTDGGVQRFITSASDEPNYAVLAWSSSANKLVLRQFDTSDHKEVFFPEYTEKFVIPGGSMRGIASVTLKMADLDSGETNEILSGRYFIQNTSLSYDGRYFVVDYASADRKMRWITSFSLEDDQEITLFTEETDGWIYGPLSFASFSPDSDALFFTSERDGWNHIYTTRADGGRLNQLTSGEWEVAWAAWAESNQIVLATTQRDSGLRDLHLLNVNTSRISRITSSQAYRYQFGISNDGRYVHYMSTTWNVPGDIYKIDLRRPNQEIQLTQSVPDRFGDIDWQVPEYIQFTGRDGETSITMDVLKPAGFDPNQTYPAVVFVHGAGSLQNVFQGWSISYPREYMFHQYLNMNGYVVVEVDFRHSTGYGRKFREDVTGWMGRYELEDILDGLDYIDGNGGYIDRGNVGIYGGSYGGFMALYALSHAPDHFHAGAALRAVTNWENYFYANPAYTYPRLGHPDNDRENYDRSSPLTYADSLSRPALILHGLIDNNVGFQDAAQYIDALIKSGNTDFDMMMYPSERHAYQYPNSWYDQYLRIFEFFERHLK